MKALNAIQHYAQVGGYMLKLNIQAQLEYPSFLIGWFIANAMQFAVGVGTLRVIMVRFEHINGWEFEQIAFMYGLGVISHALAVLIFIQTWGIDRLVIRGEFDRMLVRPLNVYYQFCIQRFNLIGLTDMLPGGIIFIYGVIATGFRFSFSNTIGIVLVIIGATMIRGGVYTLIGSVGFWTKSSFSAIRVVSTLFDRAIMYPITIFNWATQALFTFLLPLGFIAFYPVGYFLDMDMGFSIPGYMPLWTFVIGLIFMLLGRALFNAGLRHYDSAGN